MKMDREEAALDQVRLCRAAQADGDIGLAHGKIEFLVVEDQFDPDIGIEIEKLADALRQPDRAEADRGGDLQGARGALARIDEARLRGLEPHPHVAGRPKQQVALLVLINMNGYDYI